MSDTPSNVRRFVGAAWSLLTFQLMASVGAVAVTGWAAFHVSDLARQSTRASDDTPTPFNGGAPTQETRGPINDGAAALSIPALAPNQRILSAELGDDPDGPGEPASFQWLRDGMAISGAVTQSYQLERDDFGAAISVRADYVDGEGFVESVTSNAVQPLSSEPAAPTPAPPTAPSTPTPTPPRNAGTAEVRIAGRAVEGQTLTAAFGRDPDGINGVPTFSWLRDGRPIAGAGTDAYALSTEDVGRSIAVRADYVDGNGFRESVTSAAVRPLALPRVNDGAAALSIRRDAGAELATRLVEGLFRRGDTNQGFTTETLTAAIGADPDGVGSAPTWQWLRDGRPIPGAITQNYRTSAADAGHAIAVRAAYVDGEGFQESVTSEPTQIPRIVQDRKPSSIR